MTLRNMTAAFFLMAAASLAQADVVYNFNSGAQGFAASSGSVLAWQSTGGVGNTGYVTVADYTPGESYTIAPVAADLSSLLGGLFSFDYNALSHRVGNAYDAYDRFGTITIFSGASFVTADVISAITSDITGTGWHHMAYGLTDALWSGNSSLSSVLTNVTGINIVTEYNNTTRWPDEVIGFDNFSLTAAANAVPEPMSLSLVLTALAGLGLTSRLRRKNAA